MAQTNESCVPVSVINAMDISPQEMKEIAENQLLFPQTDSFDEAQEGEQERSDEAWGTIDESVKDMYKGSDIGDLDDFLGLSAGSKKQMTTRGMLAAKRELEKKIGNVASTEDDAYKIVMEWAHTMKRNITPAAAKAISSALLMNFNLDIDKIEFVLLGWELRGDHNLNEVRNIMDSHKELLNTVLASNREFKSSSAGLLSGVNAATTKMVQTVDQFLKLKVTPNTTPTRLTVSQAATTPTITKTSRVPTFQKAPTAIKIEDTEVSKVPKTIANFFQLLEREENHFARYIPGGNVRMAFIPFLSNMSDNTWAKFVARKNRDQVLEQVSKYIKELNNVSKLSAE